MITPAPVRIRKFLSAAFAATFLAAPLAAPASGAPGIMLGAFIPATWEYAEDIRAFDAAAGRRHTHIMIFCAFNYNFWDGPFLLRQVGETGKSPVICWQSVMDGAAVSSFSNESFYLGAHDTGIAGMARQVGRFIDDFGLPVYIRFAHEANISCSPAWPGQPWNHRSIDGYVRMFRYVRDRFYAELTPAQREKVVWTWSMNYLGAAEGLGTYSDWKNLYPGDAYVDMTGLSGLNYGDHPTAGPGFPVTVQWLYLPILRDMMAGDYARRGGRAAALRELAALTCGKPQGIFEFGSVDSADPALHGTVSSIPKADWIRQGYDALARMEEFSFVRLVLWYNDIATSGGFLSDFRVARNPNRAGEPPVPANVTQAYREAIADPRFLDRLLTPAEMNPGGFHQAGSRVSPAGYPQHEFWLSVRPGGHARKGETLAAAYFLYPPSGRAADACDAYVAARIPGGGFYAFVPPSRWAPFDPARFSPPAAIKGLRVTREVRGTAFVMPLGGGLPSGTYTFFTILVPPGADPAGGGPDLKSADFFLE